MATTADGVKRRSPDAATGRARGAVAAVFTLNGVLFGSWAARIPAVRDRVGAGDGQLGLVLACLAIGAVLAMPVAGAIAARVGSRRATRGALALYCAAVAVVALAPSVPALCATALALGACAGALDVTMNAHGVAVEGRYRRPILSAFHAGFSAGGLAGSALGALAAAARLDVRAHLALMAAACAAIGLAWSRRLLPGAADAVARGEAVLVRPPRALLPLGILAFAGLLVEGAAGDWSAVYLRDELGASAGTAALGFTAFSVTMVAGRLAGDRLVQRFGPAAVVRAGGAVAAGGFAIALVVAQPAAAFAGLACLGAGLSALVPIVFRAGAAMPGIAPGLALAAVSTTGYLGFMAGPPLIGALAELSGLPTALWLLVALGAAVIALSPAATVA
jgi:MFS family permease